jgi:hypothetical protein
LYFFAWPYALIPFLLSCDAIQLVKSIQSQLATGGASRSRANACLFGFAGILAAMNFTSTLRNPAGALIQEALVGYWIIAKDRVYAPAILGNSLGFPSAPRVLARAGDFSTIADDPQCSYYIISYNKLPTEEAQRMLITFPGYRSKLGHQVRIPLTPAASLLYSYIYQ